MQLWVVLVFGILCQLIAGETITVNNTLSDAIALAQDGDTIIIPSGFYNGTGNVDLQVFGRSLEFIGDDSGAVIDCMYTNVSAFIISTPNDANVTTNVSFVGITFQNCMNSAIFINTSATDDVCIVSVSGSNFYENSNEDDFGGAIYIEGPANLQIDNCMFALNQASIGSAICALDYATVGIYNSAFHNNTGNAVTIWYESSVVIINSSFRFNTGSEGASVYLYSSSVSHIEDSEFQYNRANNRGGAISSWSTLSFVTNCSFLENFAGQYGGAVAAYGLGGSIILTESEIINNRALSFGGGFSIASGASGRVINSIISGNNAAGGGGISVLTTSTALLTDSQLVNNVAFSGGAAYVDDRSKFTSTYSNVSFNRAIDNGDSIFCHMESVVNVNTSTFLATNGDRSGEQNGVFCDPVPDYQWCTFFVTNSGDWSGVCPERDPPAEQKGMAGWKIALIVVGALVGAVLIGFGVAYAISSRFEAPSFFNKLRSNSV